MAECEGFHEEALIDIKVDATFYVLSFFFISCSPLLTELVATSSFSHHDYRYHYHLLSYIFFFWHLHHFSIIFILLITTIIILITTLHVSLFYLVLSMSRPAPLSLIFA